MNNNLTSTNQNAKLALAKSKSLLTMTNNLLSNRNLNYILTIQKYFIEKTTLDETMIKEKYFISNSDGKTIKIFDPLTGLLIKELEDSIENLQFYEINQNKEYMVTYNYGEFAQLWNLNNGKLYKNFILNYTTIAFSKSGKLIAYGMDNLIVLWDIKKEKIIKEINKHLSLIKTIKFYNNDKVILSISQDNIVLWDIETEKNIIDIEQGNILNNKYILMQDNNISRIYDIENFENKILISNSFKYDDFVDICNDHKFLLTFSNTSNKIIVYNLQTGDEVYYLDLKNPEDKIFIRISHNSKYLLTCNNARHEITIYNLETGKEIVSHKLSYWIKTAFFNYDNTQYAFIDNDNKVHIVDLMTNKTLKILTQSDTHKNLSFSKNGKFIIEKRFDFITYILEIELDKIKSNINYLLNSVESVSCSPDGTIIASIHNETIKLWNFTNGTLITEFVTNKPSSIKFSPCGQYIGFIESEYFISLININTREEKSFSISKEDCIEKFSFDESGENIRIKYYWVYEDKEEGISDTIYRIGIYNIYKDELNNYYNNNPFHSHGDLEHGAVYFTKDNKKVLIPKSKQVVLHDLEQSSNLWTYKTYGYLCSIILSNNEEFIVTVEAFGYMDVTYEIVFYDAITKEIIINLESQYEHIRSIELSYNDKYLLVTYDDKNYKSKAKGNENSIIELWDAKNHTILKTFKGHLNTISSVVFHPSGEYIVSSSYDGTIKIWNIENQQEEYTIYSFIDNEWISILNNNKFNLSKNARKYISVQNGSLKIMKLSENIFNEFYQHNNCLLNLSDFSRKNGDKTNTLLKEDFSWINTILEWADNYNISNKQIPRNIEELLNLKYLDLSNNNLTSIPQEFTNLKNIESLNLSNNDIRFLPKNLLLNIKNKTHVSRSYGEGIEITISNNINFHLRGNEFGIIYELEEDTEFYNKRKINRISISNYDR